MTVRAPQSIAELREVTQPPEVRNRANAEHWTASLYLRDLSPYLTWLLLRTGMSANAVTGLMIATGWATAAALLIPGLTGPLLAVVLGQLQMLFDCCDGEVARWRGTRSPAGVFLDKVGHYSTEALIPLALGIRAAGYPVDSVDFGWTTLAALLALVIVLNKALNDMVHVARAGAGLPRLADARSESEPVNGVVARLRRAARFVPFHRLYHSVEMTLIIAAAALVGVVAGGQVLVDRVLVSLLLPLAVLALVGHFVAIMASKRVRG